MSRNILTILAVALCLATIGGIIFSITVAFFREPLLWVPVGTAACGFVTWAINEELKKQP